MRQVGRGQVQWLAAQHVRVKDAYLLLNEKDLRDFAFSFEGRAPEGAGIEEVGIWATFRQFDRNHRYVVGLRGAPHDDLYLARYAPDGQDRMLALQPVPGLAPGDWAEVRIEALGEEIRVYLNDVERIVVQEPNAPFSAGKVGVGGGYHASEYRNVRLGESVAGQGKQDDGLFFADGAVMVNFQPEGDPAPAGWQVDAGAAYSKVRGHGWTKTVGTRNRDTSGRFMDDTLVTIAHDMTESTFRLDLEPGDYLLTLQYGDTYDCLLNMKYAEAAPPLRGQAEAGVYKRVVQQLAVGSRGLALGFSRKTSGPGTSLNWLVVEPRARLTDTQWARGAGAIVTPAGKRALRKRQRAAYQPVTVERIGDGRTEVSLDGDWLFLPDYEFGKAQTPEGETADDRAWHVMNVPDLWSPYAAWLFGETFPDMPYDKGASDAYFEYRHARVEALTFDWEKTRSAWYRKHVVLPEIPQGKRFELCFDAIAKVAHVYVNGAFVGKNYGMFGDISLDATDHLKPGENVIAVRVDQERNDIEDGDEIIDVAISVEVTRKMLSALPFGMTRQDARGIWQPTKLVITEAVRITDIFVKPALDGAEVDVTVQNLGDGPAPVTLKLSVESETDREELVRMESGETRIPAGASRVVTLAFNGLSPRLWSPDDPQLHTFAVELHDGEETLDSEAVVSGFKTFEAKGNRLFLNGRPYVLRGANHCPNMLAPHDAKLAGRFMGILRENNVNATRFHALPAAAPWMDAADRAGVMISYEGTWPWLMLRGPIPPQESLDIWMDEFQRMIRKHRNHPSLALWTVNNEMKFHVFHAHDRNRTPAFDADTLARWRVVSKAVEMIRATDPTRPVVADSCYIRSAHWRLKESPEELGIDDGDIDDRHGYFNWYNESFFHLPYGEDGAGLADRPYIGQELSTGYYNGDSGHPVRAYLFAHQTPQSWVGQWAYEHRDPTIFTTRHAMLTKELAEYYRRERRKDWAGSLIFGLVTWFRDPWDAERITPYPVVTDSLRHAMAPVLVSARLTGRNWFAGDTARVPVSIVNDAADGQALAAGTLKWRFMADGVALSKGQVETPVVDYYANGKVDVQLTAPAHVPAGRADAELRLDLEIGGKVLSSNHYALRIGERAWAVQPAKTPRGRTITYHAAADTQSLVEMLGLEVIECKSLERLTLGAGDRLVLDGQVDPGDCAALQAMIRRGEGRVIWMSPREQAVAFFPEQILSYRPQNGEVVTMLVPESPVFDGIEIGDLAWWGGPSAERVPISSRGGYHVAWRNPGLTVLAEEMRAHGYLTSPIDKLKSWVTPLVSIRQEGTTPTVLCEMSVDAAGGDPIALRLWANLLCADWR